MSVNKNVHDVEVALGLAQGEIVEESVDYIKFKKLLGWFVKQLNINNGIIDGDKAYGKGYKGEKIQKLYSQWRDYGTFTLDCTIQSGFASIVSGSNYIHKSGTGIDVCPIFDKNSKKAVSLFIRLYNSDLNPTENDAIFKKRYMIDELCLYDNAKPNNMIKDLFDNFIKIIELYSGNENMNNVETNLELPLLTERSKNKVMPLNFILYGAPGTGKTYATAEYAMAIIENRPVDLSQKSQEQRLNLMGKYKEAINEGRITFTTFHQSYGYEDFIQGLRPDTNGDGLKFVPVDGVFKKIADEAIRHGEKDYVIIIDEINRANISKVFGELITLIEEDKRWGEINALSVTLPSGQVFAVPNNLFIIGTMNSADKSISLIDAALRRRFDFIEVVPNADIVEDVTLRTVLKNLNDKLFEELESTDLLVGHAYFMGKEKKDLCDIMNHNIIPLLYEYFYDNSNKVKNILEETIKGFDFEVIVPKVGRIKLIAKV